MTRWYLDTSAALKLIVAEAESAALAKKIFAEQPELVSSYLLETELRRAVARVPDLTQQAATDVLDSINLAEISPIVFREAGLLPGTQLRSLDALHLSTALQLDVDAIITYDHRMAAAATDVGIHVIAPA